MKKYSPEIWENKMESCYVADMRQDPNGEYVRYKDIDGMIEHLQQLQDLVNKQAEDIGLWCQPQTIVEDYIQQALRELHGAIEREDMSWLKTTSDDESA